MVWSDVTLASQAGASAGPSALSPSLSLSLDIQLFLADQTESWTDLIYIRVLRIVRVSEESSDKLRDITYYDQTKKVYFQFLFIVTD